MFIAGLVLLAVIAVALVATPLFSRGRKGEAMLAAVFILGTSVGVYFLIGRPDLGLNPPQPAAPTQAGDVNAMVEQLAQRLERAPDDPEGWTMLGRAYVLMGRYEDAANAFHEAMERTTGENTNLIASFAEARALQDLAALDGEAGALFERVLELDPENSRGLWYGGLAAQARSDEQLALERFGKLLERELPPEFRQVVESRVASIDPAALDALVSVTVEPAPGVSEQPPEGAVLFVFLRQSGAPEQGPPIAARKLSFFQLPQTVAVTAGDLLRGENLPPGEYIVTARISADGDPAVGPGDMEGSVRWNSRNTSSVRVTLGTQHAE